MTFIQVKPNEKGNKFRVLVNGIQRGIEYASATLANVNADQIASQIVTNGNVNVIHA